MALNYASSAGDSMAKPKRPRVLRPLNVGDRIRDQRTGRVWRITDPAKDIHIFDQWTDRRLGDLVIEPHKGAQH